MKTYTQLMALAADAEAQFDFEKVQKVMGFLNWTWAGSSAPPTVSELRSTAYELLSYAVEEYVKRGQPLTGMVCATGGFEARVDVFSSGELRIVLLFYVDRAAA